MSGNRRKAFLVSAALAGAMLMTACQDSGADSGTNSGAVQGTSTVAPSADAPAPSDRSTSGGTSGATSGATSGGTSGGTRESADEESTGKTSGGQGTNTGSGTDSAEGDAIDKCGTDDLEITASDATIGGDTDGTVAVTLTNSGGRECAISGYAGVDLETSAGSLSAKRSGEPVTPGTLTSGEAVSFGIHYPINDSGGSGVRITGLLVTPPDETNTVTLRRPGAATLSVTDGTGSPVTVGPIGSAGQGG